MLADTLPAGIAALWLPLLALYIIRVRHYWWWATASNLSVYLSSLFLLSTYVEVAGGEGEGVRWCWVVLLGTAALIAGCLWRAGHRSRRTASLARAFYDRRMEGRIQMMTAMLLWGVALVSIVVVGFYMSRVGGNVLLQAVQVGSGRVDSDGMADIRRRSVYGVGMDSEQYMAAGYVKQFRTYLLPIVMQVSLAGLVLGGRMRTQFLVLLGLSTLAATVANGGVGQRGPLLLPFVFAAYFCVVAFYTRPSRFSPNSRVVLKMAAVVLGITGLVLLSVVTVAIGRTRYSSTLMGQADGVREAIVRRLVSTPAQEQAAAVELLSQYPPAYGRDWVDGLLSVLPNRIERAITGRYSLRDSPVGSSNWLHAQLFGSWAGNVPLTRWASLWFNFRLPGVVIGGFAIGLLAQWYDRWGFRLRKTPLAVVCWQYGAFCIARAVAPMSLLLNGLATAMILLWLNHAITGERVQELPSGGGRGRPSGHAAAADEGSQPGQNAGSASQR